MSDMPSFPHEMHEKPEPESLTRDDFDSIRKAIISKLEQLPFKSNYYEPPTRIKWQSEGNFLDAIRRGDVSQTDEVTSAGLHDIRRGAEFLLPNGSHIMLRHSHLQFEDEDFTDIQNQNEGYEVEYLTPTTTDAAGRIKLSEQMFDFSLDGKFDENPEDQRFVVSDKEICPPGVIESSMQRFIDGKEAVNQMYDVRPYTKVEHSWLSEVIKSIDPSTQLPLEDCWALISDDQ